MGRGERRVLENYCLSIGCTLFFCVRRTQIIKLEKRTFNLFPIYGGIFSMKLYTIIWRLCN